MNALGQSIISRFEVKSFSSKEFIWRHEESWEDTEKRLFLENYKKPAVNLLKNSLQYKNRHSRYVTPRQTFDARWILQTNDFAPRLYGWAELRLSGVNFTCSELVLYKSGAEFEDEKLFDRAVAYLLTALILNFKTDLLHVHPLAEGIHSFDWLGESARRQQVVTCTDSLVMDYEHVFAKSNNVGAGFSLQYFLKVDSDLWMNSELGKQLSKELSYIQKRAENQQALEGAQKRPRYRRGGLLRRLFRW